MVALCLRDGAVENAFRQVMQVIQEQALALKRCSPTQSLSMLIEAFYMCVCVSHCSCVHFCAGLVRWCCTHVTFWGCVSTCTPWLGQMPVSLSSVRTNYRYIHIICIILYRYIGIYMGHVH